MWYVYRIYRTLSDGTLHSKQPSRSVSTATGTGTIAWHQEWKSSRAAAAKEALLIYNAEDCQALEVVSNSLLELGRISSQTGDSPSGDIVNTAQLKWESPYGFKRNTFAFPELDAINSAAYWDYLRERLYVKSNRGGNHEVRRNARPTRVFVPQHDRRVCQASLLSEVQLATLLQAHEIQQNHPRPRVHEPRNQTMDHSVPLPRLPMPKLRSSLPVFPREEKCWVRGKLGSEIIAYALYLNIELRIQQIQIDQSLNKLFGRVGGGALARQRPRSFGIHGTWGANFVLCFAGAMRT